MKFIIFIATRLRHGEHPKLKDFPYSHDHGRYLYQGRELTSDEFNAAAKVVFDSNYRGNGYAFRPEAIAPAETDWQPPAEAKYVLSVDPETSPASKDQHSVVRVKRPYHKRQ